jgi:hypothetical protein
MVTYKVSYVVIGGEHPGAIVNEFERPRVGDHVEIGKNSFEIVEIYEVMPTRGDFAFLHATVRPVAAIEEKSETGS